MSKKQADEVSVEENSSEAVESDDLDNDELDEELDFDIDPEELERKLAAMVYDDAGNIYLDGAGRLRDKQEKNYRVPKAKDQSDEMIRLTLYSIVNDCLKPEPEGMPFARETYDRLRKEGACDLEARTLMTTVWTAQMHQIFSQGAPDGETLLAGLAKLKVKH